MVVPPREVVGVMVDDVPTEALAVGVDVQLIVFVFSHQFGGIECHAERKIQITDGYAEGSPLSVPSDSIVEPDKLYRAFTVHFVFGRAT